MPPLTPLEQAFNKHADRVALHVVETAERLTFAQVYQQAHQLGQTWGWQALPLQSRVAVVASNRASTVLAIVASWVFGHTLILLNAETRQQQHQTLLNWLQPAGVFNADGSQALGATGSPEITMPFNMPFNMTFAMQADHVAALFLTSGTTAQPKAVAHTWGNLQANVQAFNSHMGFSASFFSASLVTTMWHCMPVYYMAGYLNTLVAPWLLGHTVVLAPAFSAASAMQWPTMLGQLNQPAHTWLSPTMLSIVTRLIKTPTGIDTLNHTLAAVMVGTAPLLSAVRQAFEARFNRPCLASYGMTEVLLVSSQQPPDNQLSTCMHEPLDRETVGPCLPGVEMLPDLTALNDSATTSTRDVAATADASCPPQDPALFCKTPYALSGYVDPKTVTQLISPLTPEGLMPTGDRGYLTDEGHLVITGRDKDLIIRGGINISPTAIEHTLLLNPELARLGVLDVAIVGKPDPFWGEAIVAFVEVTHADNPDNNGTLEQTTDAERPDKLGVVEHLKGYGLAHLPAEANPDQWICVKAFPRTATGKIARHVLAVMVTN
jgi:acyl-CoA synthetase (AMP-forming)/AMP-acid ligase II